MICSSCKIVAEYDKWEIKEYEDCYDCECIEYRCPVCGKWTSMQKNHLDKHKIDKDKIKNNKDEENNKCSLTMFQKLRILFS